MPRITFRARPKTTLGRWMRKVGDSIKWFVILRSPVKPSPVAPVPMHRSPVITTSPIIRKTLDNGSLHYDFKED